MKLMFKVCGMRDPENIGAVTALSPEYMGFIFYEKSKRWVGNNFAIPADFPEEIKRVGVFVNENVDSILSQVVKHKLHFVQLHGDESVDDCKTLKEKKSGVIKVFSIDKNFDFGTTKKYQPYVDFFLFDTKTTKRGGSGMSFDWNLLSKYDQQIPFFLSGGINLENAGSIKKLKNMNLYGVDINSGAEFAPGLKDIPKLKSIKDIISNF